MNIPLFPDQASTVAKHVDALFFFILAVTVFFTVLVVILVAWFAVKYRRRSPDRMPGRRLLRQPASGPGDEPFGRCGAGR